MSIDVAAVQNDTIVNMVIIPDWQVWEPILLSMFPQYEWIPLHLLPEGAWIGWYRDSAGNWIDNDPPQTAARIEAAKLAAAK